jgi:hypothetical protein
MNMNISIIQISSRYHLDIVLGLPKDFIQKRIIAGLSQKLTEQWRGVRVGCRCTPAEAVVHATLA